MRTPEQTQRVIQQMVEILKDQYHPQQIILFGSYASGTPHEDSDIDLLVVKATHKPFFTRLAEVRRLVSDARRGYPFEPVVLTPSELKRRLAGGINFFRMSWTTATSSMPPPKEYPAE